MLNEYTVTYTRLGPWLIGILLGYEEVNKTLRLRKVFLKYAMIKISEFSHN